MKLSVIFWARRPQFRAPLLFVLALSWLLLPAAAVAQRVVWADAPTVAANRFPAAQHLSRFRAVQFQLPALRQALAPRASGSAQARATLPAVISLPLPDGTAGRFRLVPVAVLPAGLAARYPQIVTYTGQGIDDATASVRVDITPAGFHAQIIAASGTVYIDPATDGSATHLVFDRSALQGLPTACFLTAASAGRPTGNGLVSYGSELRTYRAAVACTGEYTKAKGGTRAAALAGIVTSINRVSGIYERELAIRLVLVEKEDSIIYLNPATDPYTNQSDDATLNTNQRTIDKRIGKANYDIGHVFNTDGGGLAQLGVVCVNGEKAMGTTGLPNPTGDAFDVDFVAHEIGHQFGGNHSFNGNAGNCGGGNREGTTAYEPGSGSTIMAYAGICSPQNLQSNSDAYFHTINLEEINSYVTEGQGRSCAVLTNTGNHAPTVEAGSHYRIPTGTPFTLTGSGTDADGNALTYAWEEYDLGPAGTPDAPSGNAPIFRSFAPTSSPTRTFPRLSDLLANRHTIGELLPSYGRNLHFRLTARDNQPTGGGIDTDTVSLAVIGSAGPFVLTEPAAAQVWLAGAPQLVRWEVAHTNEAPINTQNVNIRLSLDGGLTFPVLLAANTPNDGHQVVTVPASTPASKAVRVKVEAVGNIYFTISTASLILQIPTGPDFSLSRADNSEPELVACPGTTFTATLALTGLNGFNGPVTLSATKLPEGVTATFSPATVAPGGSATVTLTTPATLATGSYMATIVATSGSQTRTYVLSFQIKNGVTEVPTPRTPKSSPQSTLPLFTWTAVPQAVGYELQLATTADFSALVAVPTGLTGTSYQPTMPLQEQTTYYWRVRALGASCGAGPYSATVSFQTGALSCATYRSVEVPRELPTVGTISTSSSVRLSTDELVADVNVTDVRITYPNLGELTVTLTAPNGQEVALVQNSCPGSSDVRASFDDQAPRPLTCPLNLGYTVQPASPLASLLGQSAKGEWKLTISAPSARAGSAIQRWALNVCTLKGTGTTALSSTNPLAGVALFPNPATSTFYLQLENSWVGTLSMVIVDMVGRQVYRTALNKTADPLLLPFTLPQLRAGLYTVQLQGPETKPLRLRLVKL